MKKVIVDEVKRARILAIRCDATLSIIDRKENEGENMKMPCTLYCFVVSAKRTTVKGKKTRKVLGPRLRPTWPTI